VAGFQGLTAKQVRSNCLRLEKEAESYPEGSPERQDLLNKAWIGWDLEASLRAHEEIAAWVKSFEQQPSTDPDTMSETRE
jgi:hypothetical protein